MNICVLGLRGLPHVMGGVETHCEQLFPLLKRSRPTDSFVIVGRRRYLREREIDYRGLKIVALAHVTDRRLETVTNALSGVLYARFVAKAHLVHFQGIGAAIAAPLAKLLGMRVIVTYHSKNYEHAKWGRTARAILQLGELSAMHFSDHVICVSRALENELKQRFPLRASKLHFIPNGANHFGGAPDPALSEACLRKYGLKYHGYVIGVGRLVPEKGFHDLVEAFNTADLPDCKLLLVGEADHQDGYSKGLRERASERIVFTGFLPHECIHALLRNASLFVLPSYNEGMPIAALEAVMAGCPVLLSDIEPNRALGFSPQNYFKVGSVDALRDKLGGDHTECSVDCSAMRETYDWDLACAQTSKLYSCVEEKLRARHRRLGHQLAGLASRMGQVRSKSRQRAECEARRQAATRR